MKENSQKIILDLCGGTGMWSKPYKEKGYNVIIVTHPDFDLFDIELSSNSLIIQNEVRKINVDYSEIYGILFAPTCTHFSLARTTAKTKRDLKGSMKLVNKGLEIIQAVRCSDNSGLKFWALENPVGYLRQLLGKPPLTFNPMDYGANYSKKTDLWGYYNFPKKKPRKLTEEEKKKCAINNRDLPKLPKEYILPSNFRPQQARRSMTDNHFAEAFYKANK